MNRRAWIVLLCAAVAQPLAAVKVKQFAKSTFAEFQKGSLQGVAIDNSGRLFLGPRVKPVAGPAEEFYLSAAPAAAGGLYVGTGHNGTVYRIDAAGKSEVVFKGEQLDVYALLPMPDGELFIATSPNGKLFRVGRDGKAQEVFDPEERFIWDLCAAPDGRILLAAGDSGAVYSVSRDGQAERLLQAEDAHIVSLLATPDGTVYAGSGERGILYEIRNRKSRVVYDAPLEEVRGISSDGNGHVFFAVVRSASPLKGGKMADVELIADRGLREEKPAPAEKSIVYRLGADGTVERIWSSDQEYAYTQIWDAASRALLVGTGNAGHLYRVRSDGSSDLLWESDSAQVFKLVAAPGGPLALCNNTAAIYRFDSGVNASGAYFSDVLDTRYPSRFGKLTWRAEAPPQTSVTLAVRAGNSENPDQTWSGWSAPFSDPENANIALAGYRFLQVKAMLVSASPAHSPALNEFRAYYLEPNQAPEVKTVQVFKPGENTSEDPASVQEVSPGHLHLRCLSSDANDDALHHDWFLKRAGATHWVPIEKNLRSRDTDLRLWMYENGMYEIRVAVSDAPDNAPGTVRTTARISAPFAIDNTPPTLRDFSIAGGKVGFSVSDEFLVIHKVEYSWEGDAWFSLAPVDLLLDSRNETFSFPLPANPTGAKVLFIRVTDEYQNRKIYLREL